MNLESLRTELVEEIRRVGTPTGQNLVAYSGGVDSALVAVLVHEAFPERSLAVIGVSPSMPKEQLELARKIASLIGIPLEEVPTAEAELEAYVANDGTACYHCKTVLYQTMQAYSAALGQRMRAEPGEVVLFNGTNQDDLADPSRLGLKAAAELRVASPLAGLTKDQVRELARGVGLPHWDYAASPCLRSRLQYGVPAHAGNLRRVEEAERLLRARLNLEPQVNLRVRHLKGEVACIELDEPWLPALRSQQAELEDRLRQLGFLEVTSRAFRSGGLSFLKVYEV